MGGLLARSGYQPMAPPNSMGGTPALKDVVLIGGGHSHVYVLKMWGMKPVPGVQLTLIARDLETPYSGMLPGHIAGHYTRAQCHIDLVKLARFARARLIHAAACGLDLKGRRVMCSDGRPPVPYDVLSIDIGSSPKVLDTMSDPERLLITPVKPIDGLSRRWDIILERTKSWQAGQPFRLVVVGAGAGGVELALAMQYRLRDVFRAKLRNDGGDGAQDVTDVVQVELITKADEPLQAHNAGVRAKIMRILRERHVTVHTGADIARVEKAVGSSENFDGWLVSADGRRFGYQECIWCTYASAQPWLAESGLAVDGQGFVSVKETLEAVNHPAVFAVGDIASMMAHPRPKAGVFAVRQGPPLNENLRRALTGATLTSYIPQSTYLSLISTGDQYAVASKGPLALEGAYLWTMKDYIDCKFMRMYQDLPEMPKPNVEVPAVAQSLGGAAIEIMKDVGMRCGGCGSKVGSSVLSRVLPQLHVPARDDVVIGLNSPDDAAVTRPPPPGMLTVQTIDFFRSFISDPYVFGMVAANHALSDCHAMNARPRTALALAVVPLAAEDKVESSLLSLLSGALKVLSAAGCVLVGGHTSEGAELALGFSVTGDVAESEVLRKGGLKARDMLILTKPVGTGTIMAAEMRGKAHASWVSGAVASMLASNQEPASVLRRHSATACTDVTGFGLLGHLVEMLKASYDADATQTAPRLGARVCVGAVPTLPGAMECTAAGITSSLHPSNLRIRRAVSQLSSDKDIERHPKYPLFFDPQTAGGLLAGVPPERAQDALKELSELGCEAAVIGEVVEVRIGEGDTGLISLVA